MISREAVIRRIIERELQGQSLVEEAALRDARKLHRAACERFGTWVSALQYAGVSLRGLRARPDDNRQRVVQKIRTLCRHGYSPKAGDNMYRDRPLYDAARRHFGCWRRALQKAGIPVETRPPVWQPKWSERRILRVIQIRQQEGKPLSYQGVQQDDGPLVSAARRYFGNWGNALTAAGVGPQRRKAGQTKQ